MTTMPTVTASMIARVRRLTDEPDATTGYSDSVIAEYIQKFPLESYFRDMSRPTYARGLEPYCLYSAATLIWEEKVAALTNKVSFQADGAGFNFAEQVSNAKKQLAYCTSRKQPTMVRELPFKGEVNEQAYPEGSPFFDLPEAANQSISLGQHVNRNLPYADSIDAEDE